MPEPIIRVESLGKKYLIRHQSGGPRYRALRDVLAEGVKTGFGLFLPKAPASREEFWALKDVSFEVHEGEVVGIIGRNGAGKSTLLKILSRITEPTAGRVTLNGRVASLLEVGTGFHPELTGRENIYLNGSILGMGRAEIGRKFDEIVAFAEVEKFLDTPVKRYSSGMGVRLGFAVAAHLEPEILVVDEVLAVGDAEFQKKCLGKMSEVAKGGRTVLFVSHNMHAVRSLCQRGVVLRRGGVEFDGPAAGAIDCYLAGLEQPPDAGARSDRRPGSGEWRFTGADTSRPTYQVGEPIECKFNARPTKASAGTAFLSGLLTDQNGSPISQFDSRLVGVWVGGDQPVSGTLRVGGVWLKPGRYALELYLCSPTGILDQFERAAQFEVLPVLPYANTAGPDSITSSVVLTDFSWVVSTSAPPPVEQSVRAGRD
jgi:lipopolysaccharide transport system ATP-binding protein